MIAKINKAKSWFFEKINKIDKTCLSIIKAIYENPQQTLSRLIKKQRKKNQINKIRNENGKVTRDNREI